MPSPGTTFDATMGQFWSPVPGDSSVSANSGDGIGGFVKVEWCTGSLFAGKTFLEFSTGPGCTDGNPVVDFSLPSGAHWVAGQGLPGEQGGLVVQSMSPLTFTFQGIKMGPDSNGKTSGNFESTASEAGRMPARRRPLVDPGAWARSRSTLRQYPPRTARLRASDARTGSR